MSTHELKPCPFCGLPGYLEAQFGREWWVQCESGHSTGIFHATPAEAEEEWNRRAALPHPKAAQGEAVTEYVGWQFRYVFEDQGNRRSGWSTVADGDPTFTSGYRSYNGWQRHHYFEVRRVYSGAVEPYVEDPHHKPESPSPRQPDQRRESADEPMPPEPTRSQKLAEAGFTRRKTGKTAGGLMLEDDSGVRVVVPTERPEDHTCSLCGTKGFHKCAAAGVKGPEHDH